MKNDFWNLMHQIFKRQESGKCHCDLLRLREAAFSLQPDPNPKCFFCIAKSPEGMAHDPEWTLLKIKDHDRETRQL
jgi:hypothetical protein